MVADAVRVPVPQDRFARMQVRSPDPACNAYLAFSLLVCAALEGVQGQETLDSALLKGEQAAMLPDNMHDAIVLAGGSAFIRRTLPPEVTRCYLSRAESLLTAHQSDTQGLHRRLFETF